jgi:hypothetical protein
MNFLFHSNFLPYEITLLIFMYSGNCWNQDLIKDIKNFGVFFGIYKSLKPNPDMQMFAKKSFHQRLQCIYQCPENLVISYVQDYESFRLYEFSFLRKLLL